MEATALGALAFGCLVYLATSWCARLARLGVRSRTLGVAALRASLCAAAALTGGILLAHAAPAATIFSIAILSTALGATCFLAALDCRVPAAIPGIALAILAGAGLLRGDVGPLFSACVTGAPFAATAIFARGSGADWRDAVVAALGGAAFGLPLGLFVAAFACLALAFARPYLARRRPRPPARFSSALAGAFLVVLAGQLAIS
jgi:hypothetical protein